MSCVEVIALTAQCVGQMSNQRGTNGGHLDVPSAFGRQTAHPGMVFGIGFNESTRRADTSSS